MTPSPARVFRLWARGPPASRDEPSATALTSYVSQIAAQRVLILSAAIGEGHDLPARVLAAELASEAPGTETSIVDSLAVAGWPLDRVAQAGSSFDSELGNRIFDLGYWLIACFPPTRRLTGAFVYALAGRRLLRRIAEERPDIVVSTYPGATDVLGRLRRRGRLHVPVVSAITDLAALRYWSHPGVDLHLVTHPESVDEVRSIAHEAEVVPVRGLNSADFLVPRDRLAARRALGLPEDPRIVVVSGGGWAVGDLVGAVEAGLEPENTIVIVLCGRNEAVRQRLEHAYAGNARVQVEGFTDRMGDLLAAADALVHSTAGLTVLEALVRGCPTISYGWGRGHIRANNLAFVHFGLADVARDRAQLGRALGQALERRRPPDLSFAELPSAASLVLDRIARTDRRRSQQVADRA
jgi:processive 1,2-diacylglycerol beta-glucosyltransferase